MDADRAEVPETPVDPGSEDRGPPLDACPPLPRISMSSPPTVSPVHHYLLMLAIVMAMAVGVGYFANQVMQECALVIYSILGGG